MSSTPSAPVAAQAAVVAQAPAPAKPLTAIQIVEQKVIQFIKQREQAIANVHAVEGAIQAGQHLLAELKAAEAAAIAEAKKAADEAEAEAKKLAGEAVTEVEHVVSEAATGAEHVEGEVKTEVSKVVEFVKKES